MQITLDNRTIDANSGESLITLIARAGLDGDTLADRPLAAQIGGRIFSLHIDPIHTEDDGTQRERSALEAANGIITLLRYRDDLGRRVYERTLQYVFIMAVERVFSGARVQVHYSLGSGLYCTIEKSPSLSEADVSAIKAECARIIAADLPLKRERLAIDVAINHFSAKDQLDKVGLLKCRNFDFFDCYRQGEFIEYFYGEMAPTTAAVDVFDIAFAKPGLVLLMPDPSNVEKAAKHVKSPKFSAVFNESESWTRLMHCSNVAELNSMVSDGSIRELIRISEALHEKRYAAIADEIVMRKSRAIMVAGPSSSGKTTSANRLYTHLRVLGKNPVLLSLDNYYVDRDKIPYGPDGRQDLEDINTLDIARFNSDLSMLLQGEEVEIPVFDFVAGKRKAQGRMLEVGADEPLIIEGIHGLNERMLSPDIPKEAVFRVYVSALTALGLDDHNRIRTTDVRLLRRMVRDIATRGTSVEATMDMWENVSKGERTWIFPYQEQADAIFNSALLYELALLKRHAYPKLESVGEQSPHYTWARSIIKFLNYIMDADVEDEIPPTSVLREFIGGNAFYKGGH